MTMKWRGKFSPRHNVTQSEDRWVHLGAFQVSPGGTCVDDAVTHLPSAHRRRGRVWGKGTQSDLDPVSESSNGDRPVCLEAVGAQNVVCESGRSGSREQGGVMRWGEGARASVGSTTWWVEHQGLGARAGGRVFKLWVGHKQRKCPPALKVSMRCAYHLGKDLSLRRVLGVYPHARVHTRLQGCGPIHLNVTDL